MSTTRSKGKAARAAILILLGAALLAGPTTGCSSGADSTTTSSGPVTTPVSSASTTTTVPVGLTDLDRELARTAKAQNALARALDDVGAANDDPRSALSHALRARAQAVGCIQMLNKADQASIDVADGVMLDIYHQLNLAREVAEGSAAETIGAARAIADTIGAPSKHVDEAVDLLDRFVDSLSPLWSEIKAVYTQMIADKPAYIGGYANLAQLLYEEGDTTGALATLDKGISATAADDKATLEALKASLAASPSTT